MAWTPNRTKKSNRLKATPGLPASFPSPPLEAAGGLSQIQDHIVACWQPRGLLTALGMTFLPGSLSSEPFRTGPLESFALGLPQLRSPEQTTYWFFPGCCFLTGEASFLPQSNYLPAFSLQTSSSICQETRKLFKGRDLTHLAFSPPSAWHILGNK